MVMDWGQCADAPGMNGRRLLACCNEESQILNIPSDLRSTYTTHEMEHEGFGFICC